MKKKVLILGAGIYQVPLIKKAKEMGLYTIVSSIPGNYPGFQMADKVIYENTIDKEVVLKIAKEEMIDGVAVCGTDVCVPTQGYLCDQLGLKGPTLKSAEIAQDKALMKKAFISHGVRTAKVEYVDINNAHPADICEKIGYPVIFKSVDSSGSRGITKVNSDADISYAYMQVKDNTHSDCYIIEKYLVGEEFGAQAFVYDGKLKFILPHGDYVFQGDTGVPIGHFAPYNMGQNIVEDAENQLKKAIKAMKIDNCAINADFILYDGKAYVLEVGARAGATCLVEMTSIYYGFDYYEKILQAALGIEPDFTPLNENRQPNAEMLFQADKTGVITSIDFGKQDDPHIVNLSLDYSVGDHVRKFAKGPDRIGQIIAIGNCVDEAKTALDRAMEKVKILIS
jgi:biotin carboxylase